MNIKFQLKLTRIMSKITELIGTNMSLTTGITVMERNAAQILALERAEECQRILSQQLA
jgi:hypothetical protein